MNIRPALVRLGTMASLVLVLLSCAALVPMNQTPKIYVFYENSSQALFDDAIKWSRANKLETGGCFDVFQISGNKVLVFDAVESVHWRREVAVQLDCGDTQGLWHTHWMPADGNVVGCNVNDAMDRITVSKKRRMNVVICGVGRDSVIPYVYDEEADSTLTRYLRDNPGVLLARVAEALADTNYKCKDESAVSLARPTINCRDK